MCMRNLILHWILQYHYKSLRLGMLNGQKFLFGIILQLFYSLSMLPHDIRHKLRRKIFLSQVFVHITLCSKAWKYINLIYPTSLMTPFLKFTVVFRLIPKTFSYKNLKQSFNFLGYLILHTWCTASIKKRTSEKIKARRWTALATEGAAGNYYVFGKDKIQAVGFVQILILDGVCIDVTKFNGL